MFNFSSKTFVGKEYKVSDFLTQIKADKDVKTDTKKIKKIVFQHIINANTLNSIEDDTYQNIYVIQIELKEKEIPKIFIEALDKNIAFHTYFIFEYENSFASMIAFKEIGQTIKVNSKYYIKDFNNKHIDDAPLINSVKGMYKAILSYEIGISSRSQESPSEYISRVKAINKLNFQISKTESGIIYETQPKRKFEYNERLRKYKKELEELIGVEQ